MQSAYSLRQTDSSVPRWQQILLDLGLSELETPSIPTPSPISKLAVIQNSLTALAQPGQTVELRILGIGGKKRTDSGYFTDFDKLAKAATSYDGRAEGIYVTVNPVNPALLARANNRVKQYADNTTSDSDILQRTTLPIDFDPARPAGISSTAAEHQAALTRAWACQRWLTSQGWPEPVFANSGNGAHLLYPLHLPNDEASSALIKNCLLALSSMFSDSEVKLDTSTSNASRIFKLYGTLACKGDPLPERPHRRSAIVSAPQARLVLTPEQLASIADQEPKTLKPVLTTTASARRNTGYGRAALEGEIAELRATPAGGRNNQLFKSSAALFELVAGNALDPSEVSDELLSAASAIGLSQTEAIRAIANGEKHGMTQPRPPQVICEQSDKSSDELNPSASRTELVHGTSLQSKQPAASSPLMHVDDLDSLPPIQWLIQDILPANNLVEVHGAPGTGKTQVVFDMAQTLAASGKTVIYVVAEGLQGYRGRKRAWQKFHKLGSGNLFLWSQAVQLFEAASVRAFLQAIKPKPPALIVFDTLSRCSLGADENNQKDMNFILEALDTVRRETGATVLAVHHTNANGSRERGSTVIRGGMAVMLEVAKDDDLITVLCSKMKDASDFEPIHLKPVLIDIGEDNPVPVLVPAVKRVQTDADTLTSLQLEILKAVGMDMFSESGIRSSQLDDLLSPTTKRGSKYNCLNTLIRLGYVKPHKKGDPYYITDEGRLKLSNAEKRITASKSNESKASPSMFIWTLPESCPMSSPVPHTYMCGTDKTRDDKHMDNEIPYDGTSTHTLLSDLSPKVGWLHNDFDTYGRVQLYNEMKNQRLLQDCSSHRSRVPVNCSRLRPIAWPSDGAMN